MTYQEIKNQLKSLQALGFKIPPLNSKKEVLEAAIEQILDSLPEEIPPCLEEVEVVEVSIAPTVEESLEIFSGMQSTGLRTVRFTAPAVTEETIEATIVATTAQAIAPTAPEPQIKLSPLVKELDFTPARSLWDISQFKITPDIKFVFEVVLYAIALCKFLAIKSTPYLIRAGKIFNLCWNRAMEDALKTIVVAGVLWQIWLAPKIQLVGYQLALWAVLIAIRIKKRGMAIA